ncbi:hypothetical protein SLE2022_277190 [Rubroshorea leprosula]
MSDGGGENGRKHDQPHPKRKFGGNDFVLAISKISVAQICENVGFQTLQQSALEALSDIAVRYIENIGKSALFHASLAGRAEGNAFDIIQGLEELGSGLGFAGASDVDHCLANSGIVQEIIQYVADSEDIPFAYSLPHFPVVKDCKPAPSFLQTGAEPPGEHVPPWLPAFPDPETYAQLSLGNEKTTVSNKESVEPAKHKTRTDRSLLNLQQRFACNGFEGPSSGDGGDAVRARKAVESNPYLAAPLHFGEKEVSPVALPAKLSNEGIVRNIVVENNHAVGNPVSVLETFAPAIEAMNSRKCDSEDGQNAALLNQRPSVHFKIGIGKKSLGAELDLSLQRNGSEKISPWFGNDNEKDDKKRRAECILKGSIENAGELA